MVTTANAARREHEEFRLGDLVLAKFDDYPYWPAVVERCFWKDKRFREKWRVDAHGAEPPKLWCRFVEDDSANWVALAKVKPFTPRTARRWQCRKRTRNFADQQKAIETAEKMFRARDLRVKAAAAHDDDDGHASDRSERSSLKSRGTAASTDSDSVSSASSAAGEDAHVMADGAVTDNSGVRGAGRGEEVPDAKGKRKFEEAASSPDRAVKRKAMESSVPAQDVSKQLLPAHRNVGSTLVEPREEMVKKDVAEGGASAPEAEEKVTARGDDNSLSELRQAIMKKVELLKEAKSVHGALQKKIRIKDAWIQQYKQSTAFADVPGIPPHSAVELPEKSQYQSKPIESGEFNNAMQTLRQRYASFKDNLERSCTLRETLESAIAESKKEVEKSYEQVKRQEQLAGEDEREITKVLVRLLEADVDLSDLRKNTAGKLVRTVLKNCGEIPRIRFLCSQIIAIWREQCRRFDEGNCANGHLGQTSA